jgi:thiamine phosphate synthase YjbQ (UPF0047 family)
MKTLRINTAKPEEVVDITEVVRRELKALGTTRGVCHLFMKHTTAALTTADLNPGTDVDMLDAFREMIPLRKHSQANGSAVFVRSALAVRGPGSIPFASA